MRKMLRNKKITQVKLCRVWIDKDMYVYFGAENFAKLVGKKLPMGLYWMSLKKIGLSDKEKKVVRTIKKQRYFGS
jgi:hypothetical protein